jgi:hypothetical protein
MFIFKFLGYFILFGMDGSLGITGTVLFVQSSLPFLFIAVAQ